MFIHMFFQAFRDDIAELPESLVDTLNLLPDLLTESRCSTTVKNYNNGFMRWKRWAQSNGIPEANILPSKSLHVALYLASLVQSSRTSSPVIQAFIASHGFIQ